MADELDSLKPIQGAARPDRQRVGWRGELALVLLPTATVLLVLGLVEAFSRQRLLFASLASSAFLIYLDPRHGTNAVRTLIVAQLSAAGLGLLAFTLLGPGYPAAAAGMVAAIAAMVALDAVHPPAVSTALAFALRAGDETNLLLFGLAVGVLAVLVVLHRAALAVLARVSPPAAP